MQSVSSSAPTPEAILEWLQKEMGYRSLGPSKSHVPSVDAIRKICRGNMIPIWNFLINRAKSDKTVESIRRNVTVHGGSTDAVKEESKAKGRRKDKGVAGQSLSSTETREVALHERELAAKEVERLRNVVRRQRKDLKARMLEVSREEAERKRMLDERANYRFGFNHNIHYYIFITSHLSIFEQFYKHSIHMYHDYRISDLSSFSQLFASCRMLSRISFSVI